MKRIWTREELEKVNFGKFDEEGDFYHLKDVYCLVKKMFGKSVEWCANNHFTVKDWMIAKPTHQEPKEGDLVYVWQGSKRPKDPYKFVFISKVNRGCICVDNDYYEDYKNGDCFVGSIWKNYELVPKLTAQEIADKVGLTVEELRGIVNK